MRAYRLTRAKYAAFSGRGSLFANGRWHWAGVPVIYCADSRALTILETLVHVLKDQIPVDYVSYEVELADELIENVLDENLPADWAATEPIQSRTLGTEWIRSNRTVALSVPSVVVPKERNLLVNANHPEFSSVRISTPQLVDFDRRLFRTG